MAKIEKNVGPSCDWNLFGHSLQVKKNYILT